MPAINAAFVAVLALILAIPLRADDARDWFQQNYARLGIHLTDAALQGLADGWEHSAAPAATSEARQNAFTHLLQTMIDLQSAQAAYPSGPPSSLVARVDEIRGLHSPPPLLDVRTSPAPFGRVAVFGAGPTDLIVIAGRIPSRALLEKFVELHGDRFTITAFDLPGMGGTSPLPLPARRHYEERPWIETIESGIANELRKRQTTNAILIGHDIGAWIALQIAKEHGDLFTAAVLVEPALPPRLLKATGSMNTPAERAALLNAQLPPLLPPGTSESRYQSALNVRSWYAKDPAIAERSARLVAEIHPTISNRYLAEIAAMDRRQIADGLNVRTLVVLDLDDESSAGWPLSLIEAGDWQQVILDSAQAPLATVLFDDVREPFFDEPLHLGRTIDDFLANRSLTPTLPDLEQRSNQTSKPHRVTSAIGFTEIGLQYWAPSKLGREVWGGVVPWDQLWRTGANEATTLSFNKDLVVEGLTVPAGTYSLFVHPRQNEAWTLILNKVPWLWGTTGYDPSYNALELPVVAEVTATSAEKLVFQAVEKTTGRGEISMAWDNRRIALEVTAPQGVQFVDPVADRRIESLTSWTILSEDPAGDATNAMLGLHDGTALAAAYECSTDIVWFRFDLTEEPLDHTIGVNLAVDTDRNPDTGMPWWGSNRATFDRLVTLWVQGSPTSGYAGSVGIANSADIASAMNTTALIKGGIELGIRRTEKQLFVGVPARHLDDDGRLALIATIGTQIVWTDDLVDRGQVELDLPEMRRAVCRDGRN